MDEQEIQCFLAVADTHSFTKAAQRLYITQPAISGQIAKLERECGTKFFIREYHNVKLSRTGLALLPTFKKISANFNTLHSALNEYQADNLQELHVGVYFSEKIKPVLDSITDFGKKHPQIKLILNNYSDIAEELKKGNLDLGCDMVISNQDIKYQSLILDEFVILRGNQFLPNPDQQEISVNECKNLPLYVLKYEGNDGGMKLMRKKILGKKIKNQVVGFNSLNSLLLNLRFNNAFTLLPMAILPDSLEGLRPLKIKHPSFETKFEVGWGYHPSELKKKSTKASAIQEFLHFFKHQDILNFRI